MAHKKVRFIVQHIYCETNTYDLVGNLLQFMPSIFQLIHDDAQDINRSDDLTRAMVGLIGDLADTFGPQLKQLLQTEWVMQLIREAKTERHYGITTRETARWAKEVCVILKSYFNIIRLTLCYTQRWSNEQSSKSLLYSYPCNM